MNKFTGNNAGIGMLFTLALTLVLSAGLSVVSGQTLQKPEKPRLNHEEVESGQLSAVPMASSFDDQVEYWSHLTTSNTGSVPFRTAGNYVFVDSNNRLFTVSGGLFVWQGTYWKELMHSGTSILGVREIVEDNGGYFWVGTNNGLLRMNSSLQVIGEYNSYNSNLKKNDIGALMLEDDGSLWVGHRWSEASGGGVTIFGETVVDSVDGHISDIIQRTNGDVWVAQSPDPETGEFGSIYVYRPSNDSSWAYTEDNSDLPHSEVDNFTEDSQGNLWMGLYASASHPKGGVVKFDGTNWTYFDQSDGLPQEGAWYTYAASDGNIYYGTSDSTMVYTGTSWNHFENNNDRFPLLGVLSITEDRDGNLVIGSGAGSDLTGGGVHVFDGSSWEYSSTYTDDGLFGHVIFGADVDTEGNIWVSGFNGASMYDGKKWTYFNEHDGMADTYAWKVTATSDGSVWFATGDDISKYKDGEFTSYSQYQDFAETIFEDNQGNVWFGAYLWPERNKYGAILKYDGSGFTLYDDADGVIGNSVTAFGEGPNGNIYASTDAGAIVFDGSSWSEFAVDGQTGVRVSELASDTNNNLWFDTQGTIKKWDGSNWTTFDNSDGYLGWTTHIEPAADGSIWLAGPGVQVIRDGHIFDLTPPGYNTTSYVITHDNQGQTWAGTYGSGLYKYSMTQGLAIESITDYPDDQGGWVTLNASGFLMDPYRIADGANPSASWMVERQNGDQWESAGTSFKFSGTSNQMSVQVPTTMPSGQDAAEHKYVFRVGVYDANGNVLGYSDPDTAFATDNVAPGSVEGVAANRGDAKVTLSWNAIPANDIKQYEIVSADDPQADPIASTLSTSLTLADADYSGVQRLAVRARDEHNNSSELSSAALAVFPIDLSYEVKSRWNLVGLPLEADQDEITSLLSQVEEGTLYEYDGSYDPAETIEPGKGYWAKFPSDETYRVTGLPITEQSLELVEGWNLISGVGGSVSADQIQDPNEILIDGTLSGFEGSYTDTNVMDPGTGYWLRASEAGTVTLSLSTASSTVQQKSKSGLAQAKKESNKVTLRSAKGYARTLYFGRELPEQVNPLSFSLPPVPPGNSFDARFGKDMSYSKDEGFTINLQREAADRITLDLELLVTYPHKLYHVKELKGNTILAEYKLRGGNPVALKSSGATAVKLTPVGAGDLADNLPDKFDLSPSYPNPFNPSTTIKYQIPEQVAVRLEVYDMVGRRVSTLIAGEQQEAGTHTVRFDASALSSGMYFVRLQAGSFKQIQKITLIK